jgi:hypothetical protein
MAVTRTALEARGRRALLWGVVFFFVIQQAAGLLFDYVWPWLRNPTADLCFHNLQRATRKPDIILFGSSRFQGLDVGEMHKAFGDVGMDRDVRVMNASVGAGDLISAEFMLRQLMHRGAQPKLVVLEISPETVTHYNRWILEHLRRLLTWKDVVRFLPDIAGDGQVLRFVQARFLPLYMHRHAMWKSVWQAVEHAFPHPNGDEVPSVSDAARHSPLTLATRVEAPPPSQPQEPLTCGGLGEVRRWLRDYEVGAGNSEAALKRILSRCRKHDIRVVLVGVPVSSAHRQLYTPSIEAAFQRYVKQFLCDDFCTFVDYRDQVPDAFFKDHHHLNPEGGIYVSRRLAIEVLAPRWSALQSFTMGRASVER